MIPHDPCTMSIIPHDPCTMTITPHDPCTMSMMGIVPPRGSCGMDIVQGVIVQGYHGMCTNEVLSFTGIIECCRLCMRFVGLVWAKIGKVRLLPGREVEKL